MCGFTVTFAPLDICRCEMAVGKGHDNGFLVIASYCRLIESLMALEKLAVNPRLEPSPFEKQPVRFIAVKSWMHPNITKRHALLLRTFSCLFSTRVS